MSLRVAADRLSERGDGCDVDPLAAVEIDRVAVVDRWLPIHCLKKCYQAYTPTVSSLGKITQQQAQG